LEEYSRLTDNFTTKERIETIINILHEEAQFDAHQLEDGSMTFEQMIENDGFIAINFDLWLLLVKYQIPSIFISSKLIPETRYNFYEFVCYTNVDETEFAFIVTPAMYRRSDESLPEYKLIVNGKNSTKINIRELKELDNKVVEDCLSKIEVAIKRYESIEDYIDIVYEKDITTNYKPRKQGFRELEYDIVSASESSKVGPDEVIDENEPIEVDISKKKKKVRKGKKLKRTQILKEAEEAMEEQLLHEVIEENEPIEVDISKKKKKTRRQKDIIVLANPPGKRNSKRKTKRKNVVEIIGDVEVY
jgi:hypothetical protein